MTITVVPVTPSDRNFDQVAVLFDDYRVHYGRPPSPQATRCWLRDQMTQHDLTLTAAMRADHACGFITSTVVPASLMLSTAWSIRDLYVVPQDRRSGIARRLLRHVIEIARAAGASRVSLQTEADNAPALTLYTAAGFQPVTGLEILNRTLVGKDDQDAL